MREVDVSLALPRTTSIFMDSILGHAYPVLDHGFVRVIDYMGDDRAITDAARISYGQGTKKVSEDAGLINYLMRHWHSTPFEMCSIKLHVKLPVFVARQWIRHRMAHVNEYSARYSVMHKEFYIPEQSQMAYQSKTNNQGRGELLEPHVAESVRAMLMDASEEAYELYDVLQAPPEVDSGQLPGIGMARELSRMILPTNIYTEWYWKTDLHNLFRFLRLRNDPHAQYEIRVYAEQIEALVAQWVPLAYAAFKMYQKDAVTFSRKELSALALLTDNPLSDTMLEALRDMPVDEFSKGEWQEFLNKLESIQQLKTALPKE